jgi:serine/threonine protein kinase
LNLRRKKMTERTPEISDQQAKLERLLATRVNKFTAPVHHRTGGVRHLYRTNYGPGGEIQAVAKVERTDVESPRAKRHLERGCTTESEIRHVIGLNAPGITRMVDYFSPEETAKYGIDGAVIVEEFHPDAKSLEEWVSQKGPLKGKQLRQFVRSYAETMRAVRKRGILHRDHKPSNILLEEDEKGNINVMITDWANAAKVDEIRPSAWPTAGGHDATHPKIMPTFIPRKEGETPEETRYDDQCEVYGMAHNIALAARGKKIFDYDPDRGTAIEWDTGKSVLTNGFRDPEKHNKSLVKGTRSLPSNLRSLVRDGMAIDNLSAYETVEQFTLNAKHAAKEPSTWRQRSKWAGLAAAVALAIGGAGYAIHQVEKANEKAQESKLKYDHRKKMQMIREFLGNRRQYTVESYLATRDVGHWIEVLGDEKSGFAAYLNPDLVYEAVQRSGGKTEWNSIKEAVGELDSGVFCDIEYSTPGEYLDNWMWQVGAERREMVNEKWAEAKAKYEARKAAEAARARNNEPYRMSGIAGELTTHAKQGFPPTILPPTSQLSQPTTNPANYTPATRNP